MAQSSSLPILWVHAGVAIRLHFTARTCKNVVCTSFSLYILHSQHVFKTGQYSMDAFLGPSALLCTRLINFQCFYPPNPILLFRDSHLYPAGENSPNNFSKATVVLLEGNACKKLLLQLLMKCIKPKGSSRFYFYQL